MFPWAGRPLPGAHRVRTIPYPPCRVSRRFRCAAGVGFSYKFPPGRPALRRELACQEVAYSPLGACCMQHG